MAIPHNILVNHVIKAIEQIDREGVPQPRFSTKYNVVYKEQHYPPKYLLSIANIYANGIALEPSDFSGGEEANGFLKRLGFIIIDETSDVIFNERGKRAEISFHQTVVNAYNTAKKECRYDAKAFIQMISERGALSVAKSFLTRNTATTGFDRLWQEKRLDLTIEASVLLPQYKVLFTNDERKSAYERLKEYGYVIQGIVIESDNIEVNSPIFKVGEYYSRKDVYKIMNVPEAQQGGNWDTGYTRFNEISFVFANVGSAGRTGHDHPNKFNGNDLIWFGKKDSHLKQNSIMALIDSRKVTFLFAREDSTDTLFMFLGKARAKEYYDTTPVNIVWSFDDESENHPEILSEEVIEPEKFVEGAVKQVFVNVYERNPIARKKCIEHYGTNCTVCHFDFALEFGDIGEGFIHVHHLKSLHEIGQEYDVDPIRDLRPVCPNCHSMLHKRKPEPYSIEELKSIMQKQKEAIPH